MTHKRSVPFITVAVPANRLHSDAVFALQAVGINMAANPQHEPRA